MHEGLPIGLHVPHPFFRIVIRSAMLLRSVADAECTAQKKLFQSHSTPRSGARQVLPQLAGAGAPAVFPKGDYEAALTSTVWLWIFASWPRIKLRGNDWICAVGTHHPLLRSVEQPEGASQHGFRSELGSVDYSRS